MSSHWIVPAIAGLLFAGLGGILGFMLADSNYRRISLTLLHFVARVAYKAFVRTINPISHQILEEEDQEFSALGLPEKVKRADPAALKAVEKLKTHLLEIYGEELLAVYMFGSRVRGMYTLWSDVDVALFFRSSTRLPGLRSQVNWAVFQVLLQEGLFIQPRLANRQALQSIDRESHPVIRRAVQTGIPI